MGYDLENLTLTKEYCWKPWEFVCMCVLMAIEAKRISRGKKKLLRGIWRDHPLPYYIQAILQAQK